MGDDIESPGRRFVRFLRFHWPGYSQQKLADLVGCHVYDIDNIDQGNSNGYEIVRKYARKFNLNPEDLGASPTALDRILTNEKAFMAFLGIEPNQEFRLWVVKTLTLIRTERSKRWRHFVHRNEYLASVAARTRLVRTMAARYKTTEANIMTLVEHAPQWRKRFDELLADELSRVKRTGNRTLPKHLKKKKPKRAKRAPKV